VDSDKNNKKMVPATKPINLIWLISLGVGSFMVALVVFYSLFSMLRQQNTNEIAVVEAGQYTGTVYDPPVQLTDFTSPGTTGNEIRLSDFAGGYVLLFFGYTHCPDVCPTTLAEFRRVKAELGEDADAVTFLFISVDAPRDNPDVIGTYVSRFDPEFVGMSANDETLTQIGPEFGLYYDRLTDEGRGENYLVDHTGRSFLIGPEGQLRMSFAYATEASIVADGIRNMIEQD
jgi:protein SCO1/2